MPAKRKVAAQSEEDSPSKRRTRSSGLAAHVSLPLRRVKSTIVQPNVLKSGKTNAVERQRTLSQISDERSSDMCADGHGIVAVRSKKGQVSEDDILFNRTMRLAKAIGPLNGSGEPVHTRKMTEVPDTRSKTMVATYSDARTTRIHDTRILKSTEETTSEHLKRTHNLNLRTKERDDIEGSEGDPSPLPSPMTRPKSHSNRNDIPKIPALSLYESPPAIESNTGKDSGSISLSSNHHAGDSPKSLFLEGFPEAATHTNSPRKYPNLYSHPKTIQNLPRHLHSCLNVQKYEILRVLGDPPVFDYHEDEEESHRVAVKQLEDLLTGTVDRGEGNSCLILGPRGGGKTRLVEQCLSKFRDKIIVLRLSGWVQNTDRLAMREIAYQITQQTGLNFSLLNDDGESPDEETIQNDFFSDSRTVNKHEVTSTRQPSAAHLPALISLLPSLACPTVVVLDAFDLFSLHPRQALLYCLLDSVQSCQADGSNKGLAVIGVTSRIDSIQLLEKRVKSRFSGRTILTSAYKSLQDWILSTKTALCSIARSSGQDDAEKEWRELWYKSVDRFLENETVLNIFTETFGITKNIRTLWRMLYFAVLRISPHFPYLTPEHFASAANVQRSRPRFYFIMNLPYPAICLLIASVHADTAGHRFFTFEILYEGFRDQVRASTSAPVQVNGGSIGMVKCSREVLTTAFEALISSRVFVNSSPSSSTVAKEFAKYRCVVDRGDVKKAVEKSGQINLKKWLNKSQ